jgi:hypothetical protein
MNLINPHGTHAGEPTRFPAKTPGRIIAALTLVFLTGCKGAPSINLLGSFFPGWMLCVALAVAGTLFARQIFIKIDIERHLRPCIVVYFCFWGLLTLITWLLFFRS